MFDLNSGNTKTDEAISDLSNKILNHYQFQALILKDIMGTIFSESL